MNKSTHSRAAAARPVAMATATFMNGAGETARIADIAGGRVLTLVPAAAFLQRAAEAIDNRGKDRDTGHGTDKPAERTMASAVAAFNALHGKNLTEREGWAFMAVLKLARAHSGAVNGNHNPDDYVDGAAYMALSGESVGYQPGTTA
jgi:hypothetical protein